MQATFTKLKKGLGQHFLLSQKTAEKIVDLAEDLEHFNVIEVGPGRGILTREILKRNPKYLLSVEKDRSLIKWHSDLLLLYQNNYKIVEADALFMKEEEIMKQPVKVIANLPYNISVALFLKWLNNIKYFTHLTLMFQKEVADRIVAKPNSKAYGSLSILSQLLCNIEEKLIISPEEFFPKPKVYSSVITVRPLETQRFQIDIKALNKILNIVFTQRRKMLRTSLKKLTTNIDSIFKSIGLTGNERPENLSIKEFCLLANSLFSNQKIHLYF
ncbi:16S rRNA (adenine(1518)-N(6)/adenine(1519)-N(6))-dimethyltransferase RsmA [Wolbachia endosymbiont of Pentidionis agamae]|uniref:16S rRNA (adenine(1518)-N(6)/adenine(1519)-N(6))- dimethyltransferase RsmA n=1 Tax=Wolbachia endosymbiont of Pentidionis agamae TaxID=3110435 RepID=UPI0038CDC9CA